MMYSADELNQLEEFFKSKRPLPSNIPLYPGTIIRNTEVFISSHLETLRKSNGHQVFNVFYDRLHDLKKYLETGQLKQF